MNRRGPGAFTIIELMIVVAIVSVLAALAVPAYRKVLCRAKQSEARSAVRAGLTALAAYHHEHDQGPPPWTSNRDNLNYRINGLTGAITQNAYCCAGPGNGQVVFTLTGKSRYQYDIVMFSQSIAGCCGPSSNFNQWHYNEIIFTGISSETQGDAGYGFDCGIEGGCAVGAPVFKPFVLTSDSCR